MSESSFSESAPKSYETGLQTGAPPPAGGTVVPPPKQWTPTLALIVVIACVGFAYDTYTLLVMPLVAQPALSDLEHLDPFTDSGFTGIRNWAATIIFVSAGCGGVFGLLGGYMTDRFGRQTVLLWSILLSTAAAVGSGFAADIPALHLSGGWVLLICRCAAFIGVCVEFVAAVAWLAELFPNPKQRERVLGYTQAFASLGGMMVAGAYYVVNQTYASLPAIFDGHAQWRYALISAVIPALPLLLIRPFLPESPVWKQKRAAGTLRRPSILELFQPALLRTSIVTALLFTCSFGVAFGAIQMTPQLVPGLVPELKLMGPKRIAYEASQNPAKLAGLKKAKEKAEGELAKDPQNADLKDKADKAQKLYGLAFAASKADAAGAAKREGLKKDIDGMYKKQEDERDKMQFYQETGGLVGRFALAFLATVIVSRRLLLWIFQVPALFIIPLVFLFPAAGKLDPAYNLTVFQWGIAVAGFLIIAQFSFWGNYLPRVYPTHLRGTGESFAANVGARMFGTSAQALTSYVMAPYLIVALMPGLDRTANTAYAAAATAALLLVVGVILTFWLPQPKEEVAQEQRRAASRGHAHHLYHRGRRRHVLRLLHARQHAGRRPRPPRTRRAPGPLLHAHPHRRGGRQPEARLLRRPQRLFAAEMEPVPPHALVPRPPPRRPLDPALGGALRRQDAGRGPRRSDGLHAQGGTRKTEQGSRQARPMAGRGGKAAGRQPDQRDRVRHGSRAEAGRSRPRPLLVARGRHLPRCAAGAVSDAIAPVDPRSLPRNRRLHGDLRLLRRLHGGVLRHPPRTHPHRLSGAEPPRSRRPAAAARRPALHHRLLRPHLPREGAARPGRGVPAVALRPRRPRCRLRVSGWLGDSNKKYLDDIQKRLKAAGLADDFDHVDSPSHDDKVRFLHGIDVLSVPTTYREPKGLYVLEALANGVPVVQPRHGSFPELLEATGGGVLVRPDDPRDLADALRRLMDDPARGEEFGRKGQEAVHARFHADRMADETAAVYAQYLR